VFFIGCSELNVKDNFVNGIYSRPMIVANFFPLLIAAFALVKSVVKHPYLPKQFNAVASSTQYL
jgi:hypothetical protein